MDLNKIIENSKLLVSLFGGQGFSLYLIHFGLHPENIICILDNGPLKIGEKLYGSKLQVKSLKILNDSGPVNIILKVESYTVEIREDILENMNSNVNFWE